MEERSLSDVEEEDGRMCVIWGFFCQWWGLTRDVGDHVISKASSKLHGGYLRDDQSSQAMVYLVQHPKSISPIPDNVLSEKGAF